MDLLFLTQTYPRFSDDTSGPFIRDLAKGLVALGDRVTVLTPHAEGVRETWREGGVEARSFRYAPERWELLGYSRSLNADEKIRWGAGAVTPLYLLAARRAVRRLLAERSFDLLHAHWVVPNALVAAPLAKRVPMAVGLHGSDVFMAEKPGVRHAVGLALKRASLVTGCSPELVTRVCDLGFDPAQSRVIPYGVDTATFEPGDPGDWRQRLGIPTASPVLLSVGRMVTKKGYHVLLEVLPELLSRHPDAHLVLGGTGDRLDEFRARAAGMPAESAARVHFPGVVMRDTLPALYRAADVFVLPAVHDPKGNVDGLPNVILEAMASGLPVVASGISGIPLAVEPEVNGLLVPEQQPGPLLEALDRLLADGDLRRRMGEESRHKATADLTWAVVAGRYRSAYEETLDRAESRP